MSFENDLTKTLGIACPIIQAPMILQEPLFPLAAAVCNAGGLGSLGCAEMKSEELLENVDQMRAATNGPFNLNFFLHQKPEFDQTKDKQLRSTLAPLFDQLNLKFPQDANIQEFGSFNDDTVALLREIRPAVVSFHFGEPSYSVVDQLKDVGITVFATATTVEEAVSLERAEVDVIIAQGWEAGGHRGSFTVEGDAVGIGTLALVPQVVDAVAIPVVAAGGIADSRGISAALELGASCVQMGTAFLTCLETPISSGHREALLNVDNDDTIMTRTFSGRPCRLRRNAFSERLCLEKSEVLTFPLMYQYSGVIKRHGIETNNIDYQFFLYGQSASLNRELSVEDLIKFLMS